MTPAQRVAWAATILVVDTVLLFVPITALAVAFVVLSRPPWFRQWIEDLYRG